MPSAPHEILLVALREEPRLLTDLVEKLTGRRLPRNLTPSDATLRFVKPAELRLDLVLRDGRKRWAIVELQRSIDPGKRRRWPLAASLLFDQTKTLGDVLVITASRSVARWAARVADVRTQLGTALRLQPVVLHIGPAECAALLDDERPALALFAAWSVHHRYGPQALAVVKRAVALTERLPRTLREAQLRAILSVLDERMLTLLREATMNPDKIPETPAARNFRLLLEAEGRKEGKVHALLTMLRARGIPVSRENQAHLKASRDEAQLDRWIERAATASSIQEVFDSVGPARPRSRPARRGREKRTSTTRHEAPSK